MLRTIAKAKDLGSFSSYFFCIWKSSSCLHRMHVII